MMNNEPFTYEYSEMLQTKRDGIISTYGWALLDDIVRPAKHRQLFLCAVLFDLCCATYLWRGSGGRMDKVLRSNPSGKGSNPGAVDS